MGERTTTNTGGKSTTARVEVLTAAVRVLMVGSRQVTLSVYNQLDLVDAFDIEPMGRVRAREGEGLVGADPDGNLVRADFPSPGLLLALNICPEQEVGQVTDDSPGCGYQGGRHGHHTVRLRWNGLTFYSGLADPFSDDGKTEHHMGGPPPTPAYSAPEWANVCAEHRSVYHWSAAELDDRAAEYRRVLARRDELEALPLIVLAGLR
jgi:hypothetical protein